ncbi:Xaa-Pro aminopeptidase (Icp55) [Carpediemonas membranifera]|uniref:Xaa-Pro aminopeptidase (Icp55) n=1 Tax=Carpediemonas membranifera TaxID=201153 RepID=A0A8J6E1X8_9EUKA|nr:Xaa-Pro aminopeptidase (Icp55) [Carpediemonas membranifera]|eukprot:KAG9394013.1 Xaa-Pro aminopeptidase (Icp55) [Carpediemonas membranifera]
MVYTGETKHIFKGNRERLCDAYTKGGFIYHQGGESTTRYNTDVDVVFRQEAMFMYLTGVTEPDFHLVLDVAKKELTLLMPRLPAEYAVWMGHIDTPEEVRERFGADRVIYVDEEAEFLAGLTGEIHSFVEYPEVKNVVFDAALKTAIVECRVLKSEDEMILIQSACDGTSKAFRETMKMVKAGMVEYQADATLNYHAYMEGLRFHSFPAITGAGPSASTLHYTANNKVIKPGQMMLIDGGFEDKCYAADITRTFPVDGKFTERQKALYNIVLKANIECIEMIRPGLHWKDIHDHATNVIAQGLHDLGILVGDLAEAKKLYIPSIFFPHGLGHLMGLEVHDVGGFIEGVPRLTAPGEANLRLQRELTERMVVTVEPGCYFVNETINPALADPEKSKYINEKVLREYQAEVGGIRLEDDILVTNDGHYVITTVPKTVEDVEKLIGSQ